MMSEFRNTIDLLGDETVVTSILNKSITEFHDNVLNDIGSYAFCDCKKLMSVDLPNVTRIGEHAFESCGVLTNVNLPNTPSTGQWTFYRCYNLTSIDLPNVKTINQDAFYQCTKLATIILRSTTVCTLQFTNAFTSTPFASGGTGGTVYVPAALIESYQTATNWSSLYAAGTCNFVAIEGSEYE